MRLNLIYARARNGVIGRNNALPWHLPEMCIRDRHQAYQQEYLLQQT